MKLAKVGFHDENTVCHCGEKMQLMEEETVLETVAKDGVLCYMCESCEYPSFIGLHVNQPDELVDQVWDGKVEPDELEVEYIYDYDYALNYHRGNKDLFGKKYNEDWQDLLFFKFLLHLMKDSEFNETNIHEILQ